jgi:hypothetical protein
MITFNPFIIPFRNCITKTLCINMWNERIHGKDYILTSSVLKNKINSISIKYIYKYL